MQRTNLAGKSAIVTGGGTGIGKAAAISLAEMGVNVTLCGRRREPLEDTADFIRNKGRKAFVLQGDVSSEADVKRIVESSVAKFETVDILINNAGIGGSGRIHSHDVATWDQVMAVNLKGPFLLARFTLPLMRAQRQGHIINVSSESGLEYYEGNGAYGVSKHALNALGEYIQRENQEYGIRVDTICPGMVVTPMSDKAKGLDRTKCLYPDDISDLIIWLLTKRQNLKIGRPILIQTMENPWQS
jgi:NAD(P)-dependent dehydrogenase (short-subunit alcohol dehydrogenase family)